VGHMVATVAAGQAKSVRRLSCCAVMWLAVMHACLPTAMSRRRSVIRKDGKLAVTAIELDVVYAPAILAMGRSVLLALNAPNSWSSRIFSVALLGV
jgi:hypothetical protein